MKVEFGFELGSVVVVLALGSKGIVQMLGYDRGGTMYYVKTEGHAGWFYGDQLGMQKEME